MRCRTSRSSRQTGRSTIRRRRACFPEQRVRWLPGPTAVAVGGRCGGGHRGDRVHRSTTVAAPGRRVCDQGYRPRVVYSSSIAVFGPPLPDVIGDDHCATPATSYGTQKAMIELLLSDHARRGFVDGIAIRLPTICVRPGKPNLAASGFFSSIIREPLNGQDAVLPVSTDVRHWFASPRSAIGFLLHAATIDGARLADGRCLTMPGVSATVGDEIEALRRIAGDDAVRRIHHEPDEAIARIVAGWPRAFEARRARALGFSAEAGFDEIIRVYVEDELGS